MFENLDIFRMSYAMAVHAGQKQAVVARNVANADTPDYRARDVAGFSETYRSDGAGFDAQTQRATRTGHLHGRSSVPSSVEIEDRTAEGSPNGNTVSLEGEMLKATDAKRAHDRALAIYKSSLGILRANLGR